MCCDKYSLLEILCEFATFIHRKCDCAIILEHCMVAFVKIQFSAQIYIFVAGRKTCKKSTKNRKL